MESSGGNGQKLYLDCVHCGLCLTSCPTYRTLGSEMDSPRGRIYLMRAFDEGRAEITDSFSEHMFRCLDCRACETACPSGVQFGRMMEDMRAVIVRGRGASWVARLVLNHVFPSPRRFHLAARLLAFYQWSGAQSLARSGVGQRLLRGIAPSFAAAEALTPRVESADGVAPGSVHRAEGERVGTVAFFTGCVMNSMLGGVNRASVRLLQAAGYDVVVPSGQICCGALANHAGLRDTAEGMAASNIAAFAGADVEAIIINAAGCGAMLKEYRHLLNDGAVFSSKVKDISEFLAGTRIRERLRRPLPRRVGYDDPCHLIHGQRVGREPRSLLAAIPGIEFVEIEGADQCCGSAGVYNITQNALSMQILDAKMEKIRAARVEVLATGNPGCMFQLRYGAQRAGFPLEVVHPVELLAGAL
ncbi:MAG TPA: (Fe-S)-binding protein [Terriglobia bacterium]|nr:(Fe-S)-binding protein [Terriglobia bacterium]